ncbi:MAG: metallophosphatase [Saprospiraceae bacterium]|nr:metallophosphatase [Saprospiraceae bacterium]MBK9043795.1 metallophosphatase [Saprospiraceae bacterium]
MNRRIFLKQAGISSLILSTSAHELWALTGEPDIVQLTILHTNDVHSRIEAFPMDGSKNQGLGGTAKRASLIKKIRKEQKNVILLDAGDIFQGTPYFNFYLGEVEMKVMSAMGYDAGTIGNHDFDAGVEGLVRQLPHAEFPLLIANYNLTDSLLNGKTKEYKIFVKSGIRIGVFGVGIDVKGLVPKELCEGVVYENPIQKAQQMATFLKNDEKCDYVICLSHLGYKYNENKVSDTVMAAETSDIDLIIGGHTHTFLNEPVAAANKSGKVVHITQVGWAGIILGRIDVFFERNRKGKCITCKNLVVG